MKSHKDAKRNLGGPGRRATIAVALGALFSAPAYPNPQGGSVTAGNASISGQGTSRVTVKQTSDRAVINWRDFSIGAGERTDFVQPSASSIALNRVVGDDPSRLLGTMTATGKLILVNPNGVLFGRGAKVDAAGLVVSTHDVDDRAFMSGAPMRFESGAKPGASIVNEGTITIREAGLAAFVAPHVRNSGIIQANLGTVELASARGFTLDLHGDRMISFEVGDKIAETLTTTDGTPLKALVASDGAIEAAGGRVYLTAEAAREVVNQSINLSGIVRAESATQVGGTIVLSGSGTVAVEKGAVISAAGVTGGRVDITGREVQTDAATIRAAGTEQGGLVRIGGAFQGGKTADPGQPYHASFVGRWGALPQIAEAERVSFGEATSIDVSSAAGAGGTAVVWSSEETGFRGTVDARGAASGGSVEISSARDLRYVDLARVKAGRGGHLLLDPKNIVVGGSGDAVTGDIAYGTDPSSDVTVTASSVADRLQDGTNVSLQASNDITVSNSIAVPGSTGGHLTLQAGRSVLVNANIATANGDLTLVGNDLAANGVVEAQRDDGTATITMGAATSIDAGTGTVTIDLRAGTGEAGDIRLRNITAGRLAVTHAGPNAFDGDGNIVGSGHIIVEADAEISVSGQTGAGQSALLMEAQAGQVALESNAVLRSTFADNTDLFDAITLKGNLADAATTNFNGIQLRNGALIETVANGGGSILLEGRGGKAAAGAEGRGIRLLPNAAIRSKGRGTVTLNGYAGSGEGNSRQGVLMDGGTEVSSVEGDIEITGDGGGGGANRAGVALIQGAKVWAENGAAIRITGTSGTGLTHSTTGDPAANMRGVVLENLGTLVRSEDGNIVITGFGGVNTTGASPYGVHMAALSAVGAIGDGSIVITGTGGGQAGATNANGVRIEGGAAVVSNSGGIQITGTGSPNATGDDNRGIVIATTGAETTVVESASGDIVLSGQGGVNSTGANSYGVQIQAARVTSYGAGRITIQGTGGGKAGASSAVGVRLAGTTFVENYVGDIEITGTGGPNATGASNFGVYIEGPSWVLSTSSGAITITGQGGASGSNANYGTYIFGHVQGQGSGDILIQGSGGGIDGTNHGLNFGAGAALASTTGRIVLVGERGFGDSALHFVNQSGTALISDGSTWAAYLPDHDHNAYLGLASNNLPVWGKTIATLSPADATAAGNRYVFANTPTLTVSTAFSDSKTYGDAYTFAAPVPGTHYQLTFISAAAFGNVWTQETAANTGVTGAPVLSSPGAAAAATVADGPYEIAIVQGTLANTAGYAFGGFTSTGTLTVTPKTLTVDTVSAENKVYDASANATLVFTTDDVVSNDDVTFDYAAQFANKNAGEGKLVTVTGMVTLAGGDASNYKLSLNDSLLDGLTADIMPATLTLGGSFTAANKTYDGTTVAQIDASGLTLAGKQGTDVVDIRSTGATGAFANKHVGNGKAVTLAPDGSGVLTGTDAANYVIDASGLATVTANITPKPVTLTLEPVTKIYDGGTGYTPSAPDLLNLTGQLGVAGDSVTAATAVFGDKNAGLGNKTATLNAVSIDDGNGGANYAVTLQGNTTSTILPKVVVVTGVTPQNKVYDGSTAVALAFADSGTVAGDQVDFDYSATTASADAGLAKPVSVGPVGLTGVDAGNYALMLDGSLVSGLTVDVSPRPITIAADAKQKVYGDPDPALTFTVGGSGLAATDSIAGVFKGALQRQPGENVGAYGITEGTLTAHSNYTVTGFAGSQLTITPALLTVDVHDQVRRQGEANPPFTYSISGFKRSDTADVVSGLTVGTDATAISPAGLYQILAAGGMAQNYVFQYLPGVLTVQPDGTSTTSAEVRQLQDVQIHVVEPRVNPSGDTLSMPASSTSIAVSLSEGGLSIGPAPAQGQGGAGGVFSFSASPAQGSGPAAGGQPTVGGSGAVASCSGDAGRSIVSEIVNVGGTDGRVYCVSGSLPGVGQ